MDFLSIIIVFFILIVLSSVKILKEYERGVIFTLGRFTSVKGPGLIIVIPILQEIFKVELRTIVMDIPTQDVISKDNVSVQVNAVVYFRVISPEKAIIQVEDYYEATSQLSQTTLRSVLGQHELDEILSDRDKINLNLQNILDQNTDNWGIKISNVEIKHVDLNENMVRAIAKQAEAERERRAKIIDAQGELQAAGKLLEAAKILTQNQESMQLRYLQTLSNIGTENNSTIVLPIPLELFNKVLKND